MTNYTRIAMIIGTIFVLFLVTKYTDGTVENEDVLMVNAVSDSLFTMAEVNLNIWGECQPKYLSEEEMKEILSEVVTTIGLEPGYSESFIEKENQRTYSIVKQGAYTNTKIQLIEMIEHVEDNTYRPNNYILVSISLSNLEGSIAYYKEIIVDKLEALNIDTTTNITITGKCNQELTKEQSKAIMKELVKAMDGQIFDQYYDNNISNIYAYSNQLDEYIITKGEKMNMDIAITYNELENMSYLYLAYPIITIDY